MNFLVSNGALDDPDELRRRAKRDGYLFFRALLDRESLLNVRRQILELCSKAGWLAEGTELMDGIATPGFKWVEPHPEFMKVYYEVMKLEDFHALAHSPSLLELYGKLFGEEVLVHALIPKGSHTTGPAQSSSSGILSPFTV